MSSNHPSDIKRFEDCFKRVEGVTCFLCFSDIILQEYSIDLHKKYPIVLWPPRLRGSVRLPIPFHTIPFDAPLRHVCLFALEVKDRKNDVGEAQRTVQHQSGDRERLCQLNGMCLYHKSQTHVLLSLPTLWLLRSTT